MASPLGEFRKPLPGGAGITLIETLIAMLVAVIGVFSMGGLILQTSVTNKNQGAETTRATIYAQDKMEKLLSLDFATCTEASPPASCNTTDISATGWAQGLLAGGAIGPVQATCPSSGASIGYVDFLDTNGQQLPGTTPATSCSAITDSEISYVRMWQISDMSSTGGPAMKQISVAVYSQSALNRGAGKPIVILTSLLSDPD